MSKRRRTNARPSQSSSTRKLLAVLALPAGVILFMVGVHVASLIRRHGDNHDHEPPPHGGLVVAVGRGDEHYHLELLREEGGYLMLYTLGEDAKKVVEVDMQMPQVRLKVEGHQTGDLEFLPFPQADDGPDKTSRFMVKVPKKLRADPMTVSIESVAFGPSRFSVEFSLPAEQGHSTADHEGRLFLGAAGKYGEADIAANGKRTAEEKFAAFVPKHDLKPRLGDKVCPITRAKASAEFSWVVGGNNYEFCCPPCIDRFVRAAKEQPNTIKQPEAYVKLP